MKNFVDGGTIKVFKKTGVDILKVNISFGEIILSINGNEKARRELKTKNGYQYFTYDGVEYCRKV